MELQGTAGFSLVGLGVRMLGIRSHGTLYSHAQEHAFE